MYLHFNKLLTNILACGLFVTSLGAPKLNAWANDNDGQQASIKLIAANASNWSTFTSKESGFSVLLPKTPEHTHQKIEIPKTDLSIEYDTYVSEPSSSVVYVISVWRYPEEIDMSKPEVNLQDGFGGMLSALPGSQVMSMQMKKTNGFDTLEFLVKNEDIYFQGELILVYNTLYQVFTVYRENEDMKDSYDKFINSFSLINPDQNKVKESIKTTKTNKLNV